MDGIIFLIIVALLPIVTSIIYKRKIQLITIVVGYLVYLGLLWVSFQGSDEGNYGAVTFFAIMLVPYIIFTLIVSMILQKISDRRNLK